MAGKVYKGGYFLELNMCELYCRYDQIAHYQIQASREGRIKSATYKHQLPVGEEGSGGASA